MNKYIMNQELVQKEINEFPIFFAFSEEQMNEGLKKFNCTKKEIVTIGYCGFIKKENEKDYSELMEKQHKREEELRKDKEYQFQMFRYELANHEYCITYDIDETLEAIGITEEELKEKYLQSFKKAKKDYLKCMEEDN